MLKIYISGPITIGNQEANVTQAMQAHHELMDLGYYPFCPHLGYYLDRMQERPWKEWIEHDLQWIEHCDALLRLPGDSVGAEIEARFAKHLEKMVFDDLTELQQWAMTQLVRLAYKPVSTLESLPWLTEGLKLPE